MFYLRMAGVLAGFVAAAAYTVVITFLRRDRSRVAHDYARMLARLTLPPLGLRVRVRGEERLFEQRPCIYLANHQSMADVPVLGSVYPSETVLIAKQQVRQVPLFGWIYEVTGNILIDRSNREQAVAGLREAEEAIRDRGLSVWIFPEGTRATTPGELLPFKKGAFHMAVAAQVPLVPVVVSPLQPRIDAKRRHIRPGPVEIRVLEPIPTAGCTAEEIPRLMEIAHHRMSGAMAEMARALGVGAPPTPLQGSPASGPDGRGRP